jgi:hypothetical protein
MEVAGVYYHVVTELFMLSAMSIGLERINIFQLSVPSIFAWSWRDLTTSLAKARLNTLVHGVSPLAPV